MNTLTEMILNKNETDKHNIDVSHELDVSLIYSERIE